MDNTHGAGASYRRVPDLGQSCDVTGAQRRPIPQPDENGILTDLKGRKWRKDPTRSFLPWVMVPTRGNQSTGE